MKYMLPAELATSPCYLVPIPAALIPLVAGALKHFEDRRSWNSDEEYERAYNAFAEVQANMLSLCVAQLIESNDRLYRLLNTALFGQAYTIETADPLLVLPAIAPARDLVIADPASVLGRMERLQQLLENALNGTETAQYDRPEGVRDLLAQLLEAIQQGDSLDVDMLAQLQAIAGLLA